MVGLIIGMGFSLSFKLLQLQQASELDGPGKQVTLNQKMVL